MQCKTSCRTLYAVVAVLAVLISAVAADTVTAQQINGTKVVSEEWGSGGFDFTPPINFRHGERLRLTIGGTARRIKVRFLPRGASYDSTVGVLPEVFDVPESKIVEITLSEDRNDVAQLSVHGNPKPWNKYDLGANNGPATLESVERRQ